MSDTKMDLLANLDKVSAELKHSQMILVRLAAIPVVGGLFKSHLQKRQLNLNYRRARVQAAKKYLQHDLKF